MMSKFWMWVAWRLPHDLVYWCAMRVAANATMLASDVSAPDLRAMDALKRWGDPR